MGLGTNLKKILKERNVTIKELSEKSGVSLNTLYSITKRDSRMSRYDIVKKVASTLGVTVSELTGFEIDEPKTNMENARLYEVIKRDSTQSTDLNDISEILNKMEGTAQERFHNSQVQLLTEIISKQISDKKLELSSLFDQLNDPGQDKAIEQVELLTKIPEYQKEPEK